MLPPNSVILEMAAYIIVSAVIILPLIYLNGLYAPKLGIVDWPKARGLSDSQIPIIGYSLVLFASLVMAVLTYYGLSPWFLVTALFMALMGHRDDRRPLPAQDKFFWQILCVAVLVIFDPHIQSAISNKFGLLGTLLAFFFILGLTNAINFIDGIDGLGGLVIVLGSLGFLLLNDRSPAVFPHFVYNSAVIGLMIPFLYLNVKRRKGFLGNVGSYFFSYTIAASHLSLFFDGSHTLSRFSISGLCFLIPIADGCTVSVLRLLILRSPFDADKGHLHHRLIQSNIPLRYILATFSFIGMGGVITSIYMTRTPFLGDTLFPFILCTIMSVTTAALILLIEKASRNRIQSYFFRLDQGQPIHFIKYEIRNTDGAPLSSIKMRRLECLLSAEIRISDMCFTESNHLYLALKSVGEPLKGISSRVELVFQQERVEASRVIEQSEFSKCVVGTGGKLKARVKKLSIL